jgi:carboxyl-terminal processing protease
MFSGIFRKKIFAVGLGAVLLVTCYLAFAGEPGVDVEDDIKKIIARMEKKDLPAVWRYEEEIAEYGEDAKAPVKRFIPSADAKVQVVLAHLLFRLHDEKTAGRVLIGIATNKDVDSEVRTAAIGVLATSGNRKHTLALSKGLSKIVDPIVQVAANRFLFEKLKNPKFKDNLKKLLKLDDYKARCKAAIALAELKDFETPREILRDLSTKPTPDGRLAKALLDGEYYFLEAAKAFGLTRDKLVKLKEKEIEELKEEIEKLGSGTAGNPLLREILEKIMTYYVEDKSAPDEKKKLITEAARGIAGSLDRFSSYMDEKETKAFQERVGQQYSGIGAVVTKSHENDFVTIDRPIYSGPAYKKGLRYGDQIAFVEGETTTGKELSKVVSILKGPKSTDVKISIYKRGSAKVHHFIIGKTPQEEMENALSVEKGSMVLVKLYHSSWAKEEKVKLQTDAMQLIDLSDQAFYPTAIGAYVTKTSKNDFLTVAAAVRGGTAWKHGLRDGDIISKINGESTVMITTQEAVARLTEKAGTPLELAVYRRGSVVMEAFTMGTKNTRTDVFKLFEGKTEAVCKMFVYPPKPEEVTITRQSITMPSVKHRMLPGNIGYVSLAHFGEQSGTELKMALLDLRGNPGGLLGTAVSVSDCFIGDGKLIVYSEGRHPIIAAKKEYFATDKNTVAGAVPIVVLVNKGSASASEIVSGCLKDHKRATIMGVTTFGKGSVQQLMPMRTTGGRSVLRITISKYYLPSGRSIHETGVKPDIEIEQPEIPGWQFEEIQKLRDRAVMLKYLKERYRKHKGLFTKLAENDRSDPKAYPDFDEWYKGLGTKAEPDYVRWLLRQAVRRRVADDRGGEFITDVVDDTQLQRAISWCFWKTGKDLGRTDEYKFFGGKFKEPVREKKEKTWK